VQRFPVGCCDVSLSSDTVALLWIRLRCSVNSDKADEAGEMGYVFPIGAFNAKGWKAHS